MAVLVVRKRTSRDTQKESCDRVGACNGAAAITGESYESSTLFGRTVSFLTE